MVASRVVWAVQRCWLWLAGLWHRRISAVVSTPVAADCAHTADPHSVMVGLLRAVNDPQRFAGVLAGFANCPACSTAVIAECIYSIAGMMLADSGGQHDDADDWPLACTCDRPSVPEVAALRLVLAADADDDDVLSLTLGQIAGCFSCSMAVILALVRANLLILRGTNRAWRPAVERYLLRLLDEQV